MHDIVRHARFFFSSTQKVMTFPAPPDPKLRQSALGSKTSTGKIMVLLSASYEHLVSRVTSDDVIWRCLAKFYTPPRI